MPEDESSPRPAPQRVAWVMNEFGEGGAQRSALTTALAWPHPAPACVVIAARPGSYQAAIAPRLAAQALSPDWPRPRAVVRFVLRLRRTITAESREVIFSNGFGMTRIVLLAAALGLLRARIIVVERNTFGSVLRSRYRSSLVRWTVRTLTRLLYRKAAAIIGVSDGVSRDLEHQLHLSPGTVTTIPNPVDVDHIRTAARAEIPRHLQEAFEQLPRPRIITAGRLVPVKAQADLITAFAALPHHQQGSLILLGEGPLRDQLRDQAIRLGLADHVWMPGFVDNPWWFIERADLFCLTSHHEGHPRVLLEALACGTPIVSTDCPSGPREILDHTSGTRLTPVGDPPALTSAISELLTTTPPLQADLTPYRPDTIANHYAHAARSVLR